MWLSQTSPCFFALLPLCFLRHPCIVSLSRFLVFSLSTPFQAYSINLQPFACFFVLFSLSQPLHSQTISTVLPLFSLKVLPSFELALLTFHLLSYFLAFLVNCARLLSAILPVLLSLLFSFLLAWDLISMQLFLRSRSLPLSLSLDQQQFPIPLFSLLPS